MNKLDAVNACLRAVTLSPVTSLTSGPDATKAAAKVDEVSQAIQEEGWSVNTDYNVTLVLDINGKCPLPANTLVVSGKDYNSGFSRVSLRYDPSGTGVAYLWDVDNKTFIFSTTAPGGVQVDITYLYAFEDLPPTLQRYIAARAAREYQESDLGSGVADKFTSRREQEALTTLLEAEADEEDWNVLRDCPSASLIASRYNIFDGV